MKAAPVGSLSASATRAAMPSLAQVASAISPKESRPSRDTKVNCAPARAAATAWFEPLPPGPMAKPEPAMVSPTAGIRPARKARSATKMPRMATPLLATSGLVRGDDALLEDKAAVEAAFAGLDHRV